MIQRFKYQYLATALVMFFFIWIFLRSENTSSTIKASSASLLQKAGTTTSASKNGGKLSIAIITMTTQQSSYLYLSLKNKWKYSQAHGYDLIVDYGIRGDSPVWHKLNMMEDAIDKKKYDWIWWIDFDTLLTNMSIKLDDIINDSLRNHTSPEKVDWLLTADCFPLNAGSMLLRSGPRAKLMIDSIRQYKKTHEKHSEQDCLRDIIKENKNGAKERVLMIPQSKINAFPEENACYDEGGRAWKKGDFVIHLAGAWSYLDGNPDPYGEMMRRYEKYIMWPKGSEE